MHGGLLFGTFLGRVYVCIGATIEATLAFFSARYLIGNWIQDKYQNQMKRFNEEIVKFAGFTKIPFKIFLWTLLVTVIPGTIVYTFVGQQSGTIETLRDIFSTKILIPNMIIGF